MRWSAAFLFGLVLCLGGQAAAQDEREELCGWVFPVESYRADIAGLEIALNANDRLVVNGRVVAEHHPWREGDAPAPWRDSANTAKISRLADYILVLTETTDCIDYASSRIYVLDRRGQLIASSALWSEHDEWMRFNIDPEGLTYSSAWYCGERSGAATARAVVFVLRGSAFVREERPWRDVCEPENERRVNAAFFSLMQPIAPEPRLQATE